MFDQILEKAAHNRMFVFVFIGCVIVAGLFSVMKLSIDAVPDITNTQVMVIAKTGALDPEKIETQVTYKIEVEMAGIPNVDEIRSLTKFGLSQVSIIFKEGTELAWARHQVLERMLNLGSILPEGVNAEMVPPITGLGEILFYTLDLKATAPPMAEYEKLKYLRAIQDYWIRPELRKVSGVAEVDTNGGFKREVHINFFPERLRKYGLSVEKLVTKLNSLGENFGGGYIQRDGQQIIVRATTQFKKLEDIERIPLALNYSGRRIRLGDVADVRVDHSLRIGSATSQGEETVLGTVLMRAGANSDAVSMDAAERLKGIQLPPDVEVKVHYNRSTLVNATIYTVAKSLAEGAIFVVLVLLLLLGNWRAAIIVAAAIPVSMLAAMTGMKWLGISANLMSLGAIDFGLLVDGSVVVIENIIRRFSLLTQSNLSKKEKLALIVDATREVAKPVLMGLFIIMVVYIPLLTLEGIEGKMFRPMAMTVLLALGASLVIALLVMPALSYFVIPRGGLKEHEDPWLFRKAQSLYNPVFNWALRNQKRVLLGAFVPLILAGVIFSRMGADFVPQLDEGDMVIGFTRDAKMSIDESTRWQKEIEKIIMQFPEVDRVFSRMGTPESASDPMGVNAADTFVILKRRRSAWPKINGKRRTKFELFDAITAKVKSDLPVEQEALMTQPIEMRFNEILEGTRADVTVKVFGPSFDRILEYVTKAEAIIQPIRGVGRVMYDPMTALTKSPILEVSLDYTKLAELGLPLANVQSMLATSMSGQTIGSFFLDDIRLPLRVVIDESLRNSPVNIAKIPVELPEGGTVPLDLVADLTQKEQVTAIARNNGKRFSALSIFLRDRDVDSFVQEAQQKVKSELKMDSAYQLMWGGQFKNLEMARAKLMIVVPLTLLAIFLLILKNFESIKQTLLVFSAIPFASTGGVFALFLRDINMSVSAAVGFIALSGIVILDSMVMVSFFNDLIKKGLSVTDAIREGTQIRLRPVLMTASVASLGFLPMALNKGLGAEVQRPLATVVIGGLVTSTFLTLVIVPLLYLWIYKPKEEAAQ